MNSNIEGQKKEAKQIVWNYLSIFGGRFGGTVISAVVLAWVARKLQPEGMAKFSLFLMVSGFFSLVFLNWPNSAVIRFGREKFIKENTIGKVLGSALFILIFTFTVSLILLLIFRNRIAEYIGINQRFFPILVSFILISALYDLSFYVLQTVGKMKIYGSLPLIEKGVTLLLLALMFNSAGLNEVIICFLIGQLAVILVSFISIEKQYFLPFRIEKKQVHNIVRYAWPLGLGAVSTFISNWIDIIIIKQYLPLNEVGIYSLSYRGMTFLSLLVMSTISLTFPLITSFRTLGRMDLVKQYIDDLIPQGVFFWSIFLSSLAIISAEIIHIVFGESYLASVLPFNILLVGIAYNSIGCFYSGFTAAFDIVKKVVGISVLISILKTLGDFLLVPRIGILGAAVSASLTIAVCNLLYIPIVNRSGKLNSHNYRYLVSIWASPIIFTLISCIIFPKLYIRFLIFIFTVFIFILAGKKNNLFKTETMVLVNSLEIPLFLKKGIKTIYTLLR